MSRVQDNIDAANAKHRSKSSSSGGTISDAEAKRREEELAAANAKAAKDAKDAADARAKKAPDALKSKDKNEYGQTLADIAAIGQAKSDKQAQQVTGKLVTPIPVEQYSKPANQIVEKLITKNDIAVGVESNYLNASFEKADYDKEIERITSVLPVTEFLNPKSGETYSTKQEVAINNQVSLTTTPFPVYTNPKTGDIIPNINAYVEENRIPVIANPKLTIEEFKKELTTMPTYDLTNLEQTGMNLNAQGVIINPTFSQSGGASGLNVGTPVSGKNIQEVAKSYFENVRTSSSKQAIDIALATTGITAVKLASQGIKPALTVGSVILSKPAVSASESVMGIIPDQSILGQVAKGSVFLAATPLIGTAYTAEIAKSLAISPVGTYQGMKGFIKEKPYEFGTMVVGSGFRFDVKIPDVSLDAFKLEKSPYSISLGKDIKAFTAAETATKLQEGRFKVSYEVPKVIQTAYTLTVDRFLGNYKPVKTVATGEKFIKNVNSPSGAEFDIGLIPERGTKPKIDINLLSKTDAIPKKNPTIETANAFQKSVLEQVKKNDDVIAGSFAGKILFEGARKPGDVDIAAKNPLKLAKAIQNANKDIEINPHKVNNIEVVAVSDKFGNKSDIVNIKGYNSVRRLWGFGSLKTVDVQGFKVLEPDRKSVV